MALVTYSKVEEELSIISGSKKIWRGHTPALLQWPWTNGIALDDGKMEAYLEEHMPASSACTKYGDMVKVNAHIISQEY
jgi:hypothetical protein